MPYAIQDGRQKTKRINIQFPSITYSIDQICYKLHINTKQQRFYRRTLQHSALAYHVVDPSIAVFVALVAVVAFDFIRSVEYTAEESTASPDRIVVVFVVIIVAVVVCE